MSIRAHVEYFSDNSTVHGFRELYHAKSVIWKIIWFCIIGASIGISAFQLYKLFQRTIDEPTTTIIKPLSTDVVYPSLSLCYLQWPFWLNYSKAEDMGFNKGSTLYGGSFFADAISSDYVNWTEAKATFIATMKKNDFGKLSDFYKAVAYQEPPGFYKTDGINFTIKLDTGNFGTLCYVGSNDSIKESFSKEFLGIKTIELMYFTEHFKGSSFPVSNAEMRAYQAVGLQKVIAGELPQTIRNISYVQISPKMRFDDIDSNWIIMDEDTYHIHVTVSSSLNVWLNNGDPDCNVDQKIIQHYSYCTEYCKNNASYLMNYCVPILGAALLGVDEIENVCENKIRFLSNISSLHLEPKVVEPSSHELTRLFDSCVELYCKVPCMDWKHTSTYTKVVVPSQFSGVPLNTIITVSYPSKSSILEIVQIPSQNWESLVGDIGGIVGLWLGASVMSVIQVIYLLCCQVCDKKISNATRRRTKATSPAKQHFAATYLSHQPTLQTKIWMDTQRNRTLEDIVFYPRNLYDQY